MKFNLAELIKTKTFWTGIGAIITGISIICTTGDVTTGIQTIVGGIMAIVLRDAIAKK